jgi:hypothetical protein
MTRDSSDHWRFQGGWVSIPNFHLAPTTQVGVEPVILVCDYYYPLGAFHVAVAFSFLSRCEFPFTPFVSTDALMMRV